METKETYIAQLDEMIELYESVGKKPEYDICQQKKINDGICDASFYVKNGFSKFLIQLGFQISKTSNAFYWCYPVNHVFYNIDNKKVYELAILPRIKIMKKIKNIISKKDESSFIKIYDNYLNGRKIL